MDYNPFSLQNKTILVTGASSGIGRAIAVECSRMGALLITTGRNEERLKETLVLLSGEGHSMLQADLVITSQVEYLVSCLPKLDGIVVSAGVNDKSLIKNISMEKIGQMMSINFMAPVLLLQSLLKKKKINKFGSIVFLSSISAFYPTISNGLYASSKGALNAFSRVLALEVMGMRIRVNCIQPAFVETEMLMKYPLQEEIQEIKDHYPMGRFAKPEEIAYAAVYFLADVSQWVTGNFFTMDGGFTLR